MFDWCQIFYLCANESMKINLQITEMCWIVTKSYWSSFICTGQELDFLNFYTNKFTCAIHFFHQMVDFTFWSSTYIWRICTICYKRQFEMIVDNLTVVYFYAHLYTTLFPGKIVKSNHYRHIFFHEKKTISNFHHFFCQHNEKKISRFIVIISIVCCSLTRVFMSTVLPIHAVVTISQILCTQ